MAQPCQGLPEAEVKFPRESGPWRLLKNSPVSGGTDNHLMLVDVTVKGFNGKEVQEALDHVKITVNKNMIPFDQRKPMDPSGIRVGTPALTTRGMGTDEMRQIGSWMLDALQNAEHEATLERIRGEVLAMCGQFPVPAAPMETV